MRYLKQSTSVDVGIGPFLDETDGKTAATGLTITQPDVRLKKNGGAWAQKAAAQTLSHEEAGWYEVTLDTTDTDTIGILLVAVHESGALPVWMEFHVLAANVYDSLFGSGDVLDVSVTQFAGSNITSASGIPEVKVASIANNAVTAAAVADGAIDAATFAAGAITATVIADGAIDAATFAAGAINAAAIATGAVDADALAADAVAEIADGVWDEATAGHATAGSTAVALTDILTDTGTTLDGRIPAALVGGRMDANVGAVSADATAADNLEAMLDGTGGVTLTTALTGAITGNITGNLSGSVGSVTGNVGGSVGSVTGAVGSVTGNVGGNVTGSVGSLAAQAKTDVNTEVLDVLNTDTFAEPGQEAPGATVSLVKKIGYLYKAWRNKKTQTATTMSLFADDATTVDQKATTSDDGTTGTVGEIASGP